MNGKGNRRYKARMYSLGLICAGTAAFAQTPGETSPSPPSSSGAPVRIGVRMDSTHHPILGEERYPKESVHLGETGKCIMRAQVDTDGGIRAFQLLSSSGFARLDQACFASLVDARLIPAMVDGKAVASWDLVPITWSLNTRPPVPDRHPDLSPIPQVKQDFQLKVGPDFYPPESRKRKEKGICVVHVYVAADGSPSNVTLTQSTGFDELDQACRSAVHEARFDPGKENGTAIGAATDIIIIWQAHENSTSSLPASPTQPLRQLSVPPPVVIPNGTPVRIDPKHPAIVREEYYPAESKRLNEQGSCMVKLTVGTDGSVQDAALTISTGYSRLDTACLKAFRSKRFLPATQNGNPIVSTIELPINWRLGTTKE